MSDLSTKEIVKKYGFRFTKSLGQNFLIDDSVLMDIVEGANVSSEDLIIEIGPGVGTLTKELLKRAKKVFSIELDADLIPILKEELKEFNNFDLIHKDALKVDFNSLTGEEKSIKVVANLPYYVTTPIIAKLLNDKFNFKSLTIMIQKEVAERIAADPNTKEYGALSILVQYYCDTEIVRKVAPSSFIPQPKVDSIVIKLNKLEKPRVIVKDEKLFFRVSREAFNMRRKTLWNALKALKIGSDLMEKAFINARIDSKRRGETLSLQEFADLSNAIYDLNQ
ncbi:16S rRNA (adenine(1518)-N(6)/adenine(1519)-N(6))-dimethyltransferase RsmA [Clostridium sp. YIM B02515]|uniref:Ribosomal RNA small subunit methyltransferase A n=1 Tax=Clostridium rhizosphaerae TaxID=2803861 RepID=A0ABS1TCM1_9CLOT|nr:16S rRNA (adenine(1518)-N(6)/adenine(1519)-N(6))-dimethyltransferase RsmA [Clostridium rhizosphaerae]MBL4936064.1 16S rRNA (adenine(1518)-N(6)/adenine(1519)-N(6))-dimethyltransferase RsmA [Clostridium rhizosphaerae]